MGGAMSLNKGKRAEREVIKILRPIVTQVYAEFPDLDEPALQRNTLQSDSGGYDIVGIEWMALEVKHHEKENLKAWWDQTLRQCGKGQEPVLFFRRNKVKWRVAMKMYRDVDGKKFFTRAIIDLDTFLIYFEHRLRQQLQEITTWL